MTIPDPMPGNRQPIFPARGLLKSAHTTIASEVQCGGCDAAVAEPRAYQTLLLNVTYEQVRAK
jgi:hypothetical protein